MCSSDLSGAAAAGAGIGPAHLHYVLGITKAYTTRVGSGPFPTELMDDMGERLRQRGHEFGATTGRPRRTGWFDAAAMKRSTVVLPTLRISGSMYDAWAAKAA